MLGGTIFTASVQIGNRQGLEKLTMSHRLEQLFQGLHEEHNPAPKQARPLNASLLKTLVVHLG